MSAHTSIGPARRRSFSSYLLLYVLAAAFAAAYLGFLGVRPDLIASRQDPEEIQAKLDATQRHVAEALGSIDPLRETVGEVKTDLANVKVGLDEAAQRDRLLLDKVETLERAAAETQQKVAEVLKPAPASKGAPSAGKSAPAANKSAPAANNNAAAAKPTPKAAAAPPKNIETGSIEAKPAAAKAAPSAVGVLLATGPSVDSLRLSWNILNDRHADAVRSLQARYVVSGKDADRTYGLVAGPLQTVAEAKAVCKLMMDRGEACEVSQFRGNAF